MWEKLLSWTEENCGNYSKIPNEFWDYEIPDGLKYWILKHSYNGLEDLKDNIMVQNQFKTYLSSILQTDASQELRWEIINTLVSSLLNIWDENESLDELSFLISLSDEEFMSQVIFQAFQQYQNNGKTIPEEWEFEVQWIAYPYSDYNEKVFSWGSDGIEPEIQEKQSVTEYLDEFWLPESTKKIIETILEEFYDINYFERLTLEEKNKLFHNFIILTKYVVAIESSGWKYVVNSQWSSAKWPFQYLDGFIDWKATQIPKKDENKKILLDENGKEILMNAYSREEEKYSPFDTGLRRNMMYYASMSPEYSDDYYNYDTYKHLFPEYIKNGWEKQPNFSPLDFTQEESINFWLIDSFINGNKENKTYFIKILFSWDIQAAKDFYSIIHHTKTTPATKIAMKKNAGILNWLSTVTSGVLLSPFPKPRPKKDVAINE